MTADMERGRRLQVLYDDVERRAAALSGEHAGWPCTRGCAACCRSLARVPDLTRAEWQRIEQALASLPNGAREEIFSRARALTERVERDGPEQRCECPFLDRVEDACRIYQARPLACRTYGFFAGRTHDAWCERVSAHVAGARDALLLGNLDGAESELARIDDERRSLLAWLGLMG